MIENNAGLLAAAARCLRRPWLSLSKTMC